MNLQEKLESANRLYEDLKKGKEELDARKEIYERLACVCIHNTRPVCSSVQNIHRYTVCHHGEGSTTGSSTHTHTHCSMLVMLHALSCVRSGWYNAHTERSWFSVQDPVDICS